jgi:hypothetical protein
MTNIRPKDGDYVVVDSQWSYKKYEVRQVKKVTPQMYFYDEDWFGKPRQTKARLGEILFSSSDEAVCKGLADRLKSSLAQREKEERDARSRWESRQETLINDACAGTLVHVKSMGEPNG